MTASVALWSMTTSSARCLIVLLSRWSLERIKQSQRFFSCLNATKTELAPKIRLVLWLADRMLRLLFVVLAMH